MKLLIIIALLGMAVAQEDTYDDVGVVATLEWPQNDDVEGGALVQFAYSDVEDGSCTVQLPTYVKLFHAMNAHIVPGDKSNPLEGRYQITAQAEWEAINGTVNALIIFDRDSYFNISEIDFVCDPADSPELSVYSFPQNTLQKEASSNIYYKPGFHKDDVLTITLPQGVDRFNFTTMDSEFTVETDGATTWTLSGFKNEPGINDQKEVHFSIDYAQSDDGSSWFSASEITASVQNIPSEDVEDSPKI